MDTLNFTRIKNGVHIDKLKWRNSIPAFENSPNTTSKLNNIFRTAVINEHFDQWLDEIEDLDDLMTRIEVIRNIETPYKLDRIYGGSNFNNYHSVVFDDQRKVIFQREDDYTYTASGKLYFMPRWTQVILRDDYWHIEILRSNKVLRSFKTAFTQKELINVLETYYANTYKSLSHTFFSVYVDTLTVGEILKLPVYNYTKYSGYVMTINDTEVKSEGPLGLLRTIVSEVC